MTAVNRLLPGLLNLCLVTIFIVHFFPTSLHIVSFPKWLVDCRCKYLACDIILNKQENLSELICALRTCSSMILDIEFYIPLISMIYLELEHDNRSASMSIILPYNLLICIFTYLWYSSQLTYPFDQFLGLAILFRFIILATATDEGMTY